MAGQSFTEVDQLSINAIRILSAEMVQKAKSGHPGLPMGAAALAYVLFQRFLNFSPKNPNWHNRDRFVLSAGHGSALLYSLLYLTGYPVTLDQLKNFRQWGSPCAGHPEFGDLPGIETTTGPLGQGFAVSVGMAMAERYLAAQFNRPDFSLFDYHTYCLAGDGCMMEGISSEASSMAGHLGLNKLIVLYDSNRISIDGSTDLAFTENVCKRYESYNWNVLQCDGLDLSAIEKSIAAAKAESKRPTLIVFKTHIGYGSPHKQDTADAHGAPLGEDELQLAKDKLGWKEKEWFSIPEKVLQGMRAWGTAGDAKAESWMKGFSEYRRNFPELAETIEDAEKGRLPKNFSSWIPAFKPEDKPIATRAASGKVLNAISQGMPLVWGGSADLAESNSTLIKDGGDFSRENLKGRNIRFGVREHAMAAISNGLAHSRIIAPYAATFLIFSDYMRPSLRLAALMGLPVVYVFTHDSIFLGEDGPTHQPIEQLSTLRAIPHFLVIRPADAKETVAAWQFALQNRQIGHHGTGHQDGRPMALCLTRQAVPVLAGTHADPAASIAKGGYIVRKESKSLDLILIATGSEVSLACQSAEELEKSGKGVRVVSMPCREIFLEQPSAYQESILPASVKRRMVIEAASPMGWGPIAGTTGIIHGINRFGASAPQAALAEHLGFTVVEITRRAQSL